jgi:aminoacrylate hydrolase
MSFLRLADGVRLAYDVVGEGPSLLLVTGLGGTADFWSEIAPRFAERFTVILHDHRGTGRSDRPEQAYSIEGMTADVVALMDHLGIEKASLVGHSTGGAMGQVMALDHPGRLERLVVSQSWAGHDPYFETLFETRLDVLARCGLPTYARLSTMLGYPPAWISAHPTEFEAAVARLAGAISSPAIVVARIRALLAFDRRAELRRVAHPTLVMGVRDDAITPFHCSQEMAALIPGARLLAFREGGHFFPRLDPDAVLAGIMPFLQGGRENGRD